jgi:gas vesicle protein GvpL/GvpF
MAPGKADRPAPETVVYVYGIFPGDIKLDSGVTGVGDPPGKVRIIRCGDIAALVSDVAEPSSLGSPKDLTAHKEILDASVTEVPVLPMRFGALLGSDDDVADELLAANHDLFASALNELDGLVQCVVKGRYSEQPMLREVLSEDREAARLRDQIRGTDPDTSHSARIRLGEIVDRAVAAKRENDTRMLVGRIASHCEASVVREPAHEWDAVNVALLVKTSETEKLQQVIDDVAHHWDGRVDLRLLGPMAAYDFVGTTGPET